MRQNEEFTPLRVVRKNLTDFDRCAYRVYKSPTEYITVEAATALEAFRESGIRNPLRIQRETRFMERLVDQNKFTDMEEIVETGVIMEAPQSITGHREAVPQTVSREAAFTPVQAGALTPAPSAPAMEEPHVTDVEHPPQAAPEDLPHAHAAEPPAAAVGPEQAAPAVGPAPKANESELSEADIHALLGEEGIAQAEAATAGEEGLSPDDVAKLLE